MIAIFLFSESFIGPVKEYYVGGWSAVMGIKLILSRDAATMILMIFAAFLVNGIINYNNCAVPASFHSFSGVMCASFIGLVLTDDLFNFYVFLELSSVSIYILLALGQRTADSYRAAFNYLIIGSIGGMLMLLGILLVYSYMGTLNMSLIADAIRTMDSSSFVVAANTNARNIVVVLMAAYILMTLALMIKIGLFPMFSWLLRCYLCNHSHTILLFVGLTGKIVVFAILKINYMFGVHQAHSFTSNVTGILPSLLDIVSDVFLFLGALMIIVLAVQALNTNKLKKVIMLSSLGQNGYWIIAIFCDNAMMRQSFMMQLIAHTIAIIALLVLYGACEAKISPQADMHNIGATLRSLSLRPILFLIPMLSIIGLPFTIGFAAKWQFLYALFGDGNIFLIIVVICGTILALLYTFKVAENLMFSINSTNVVLPPTHAMRKARLLSCGCIILLVLFGIFTQPIIYLTSEISKWRSVSL